MRFSTLLGLAGLATASPITKRSAAGQTVVYWGQNGGGTIENNDLSAYCTSNSGIDILVLSFLYQFGQGRTIPGGTIGQSCFIASSGEGQQCDALSTAIATCKSQGVKIILSLGGAAGSYSLGSQSEAEAIGQYLWDSYGNSGNTTVARPFGDNFVDGFDFDIEANPSDSSKYYQYMISTLRQNFAKDTSNQYYITAAPQCPIPEPNMGEIISSSQFDYIWVQFYNNNNYTVPCALGINGDAPFNYNNWTSFISEGPSKDAKIFIGVPASTLGANGSPTGSVYYATPAQLSDIVNEYKTDAHFGGVMMWAAGFSDANVIDGCTYAQEVHSILNNGAPCGGGGSGTGGSGPTSTSTVIATATTATTTTTAPTSTTTTGSGGTVAQWGQCGGQGYTGPTQCQSPYKCVSTGTYWSQCQ